MKPLFVVLLSLLLAMVVISLPCQAQQNVINACYQKNNGQLRLVADASECRPSEIATSWNVTGPVGPQGPKGNTGPQGPPGASCSPLRLFDSQNSVIGLVIGTDSVLVQEGNDQVLIPVTRTGFDTSITFFFSGYDCPPGETKYLLSSITPSVFLKGTVVGSTLYLPDNNPEYACPYFPPFLPVTPLQMNSMQIWKWDSASGQLSPVDGSCRGFDPNTGSGPRCGYYAVANSLTAIDFLQFVPPFKVQ